MTPKPKIGAQRAFWSTVTIVAFLTLLWLPTLDHFLHLDHASMPAENRLPARWPHFGGVRDSRNYVAGLENYFNDHFGFRKRLIRWNNHWKGQWFGADSDRDVIVGRDGWLFFSGNRMIDHWTRQAVWTQQDLENWRRLLEMRRDWLRERGCKYVLVIPPDKHTVYPEYLPGWLVQGSKPSKVRQLVDYMKSHSTVEVLDLGPALIAAKTQRIDYLKTDTHWNRFGAFISYRTMIQALSKQFPGLAPLPLDAYTWKSPVRPAGDLAKMLGRTESYSETQAAEPVPTRPILEPELHYDPERLPQTGPKETWPCFTLNPRASGKAIVFHDSFACAWYSFLGQHFKEVIYIWHYDWDRPLIQHEKPDIVIDEILERFFNDEDSFALARKDLASETDAPRSGPIRTEP